MKGTDHFKRTIQMFLEQRAAEDELFAKSYRNPAKNIDDCVTYILNYVQKSGCNGFSDGEIYGQAIHYYDENEIEVGKPIQCQSSCKPCGGTDRRGKAGSKEERRLPNISRWNSKSYRTATSRQRKRNTSPTLII